MWDTMVKSLDEGVVKCFWQFKTQFQPTTNAEGQRGNEIAVIMHKNASPWKSMMCGLVVEWWSSPDIVRLIPRVNTLRVRGIGEGELVVGKVVLGCSSRLNRRTGG